MSFFRKYTKEGKLEKKLEDKLGKIKDLTELANQHADMYTLNKREVFDFIFKQYEEEFVEQIRKIPKNVAILRIQDIKLPEIVVSNLEVANLPNYANLDAIIGLGEGFNISEHKGVKSHEIGSVAIDFVKTGFDENTNNGYIISRGVPYLFDRLSDKDIDELLETSKGFEKETITSFLSNPMNVIDWISARNLIPYLSAYDSVLKEFKELNKNIDEFEKKFMYDLKGVRLDVGNDPNFCLNDVDELVIKKLFEYKN